MNQLTKYLINIAIESVSQNGGRVVVVHENVKVEVTNISGGIQLTQM